MTFRLWIYGGIIAVLSLAFASTCGYERGKSVGQSEQRIATDKQALTVAQKSEHEAQVKADYYKLPIAKQKATVASARYDVKVAESGVSITGDSANVNGDTSTKVVVPALINIIDRYRVLDTANAALDSLHDKHAAADSVARDAAAKAEASAVQVISDQNSVISPRCGRKCGIAIGVGSVVVALIGLHHVGFHF